MVSMETQVAIEAIPRLLEDIRDEMRLTNLIKLYEEGNVNLSQTEKLREDIRSRIGY